MSPHRSDCPAAYYTDMPWRCRCALLEMLDDPCSDTSVDHTTPEYDPANYAKEPL